MKLRTEVSGFIDCSYSVIAPSSGEQVKKKKSRGFLVTFVEVVKVLQSHRRFVTASSRVTDF